MTLKVFPNHLKTTFQNHLKHKDYGKVYQCYIRFIFFFLQLRVIIPSKPSDCCLGLSLLLFMENIYNSLYQIWVSLETKIQVEYLLFFFCFFILGPNKMLFNVTDTWKIQKYLPAWTRVYKVGYGTGQCFNHSIY